MGRKLNLDTFGEIMDKFIEENHVQMLIDLPEGRAEPDVRDNTGLGGVVQFYILLTAMKPIYKSMYDNILDHGNQESFIDGILEMLKAELLPVTEEEEEVRE